MNGIYKWLLILILFLLSAACSSPAVKTPEPQVPAQAEVLLTKGDHRVGTYVSSWNGFRTSSYWIEGPTGLIVIDTQFLPSEAEEMLNWAEQTTGKKVVLAIILHSNPDKFNGTSVFQKRGIKVVTSAQVLKEIPAVHKLRTGWFFDRFKPDYPTEVPTPESFGDKTTELTAGGITLKAHVVGRGCSAAHVVVEYEKNVFVGDLVTVGFHSWLELGYLNDWLKDLDYVENLDPKFVRTGRGGSSDIDSVARERDYLLSVKSIILSYKKRHRGPLNDAIEGKIVSAIEAKYPSYDYPTFIENGIPALWKSL